MDLELCQKIDEDEVMVDVQEEENIDVTEVEATIATYMFLPSTQSR